MNWKSELRFVTLMFVGLLVALPVILGVAGVVSGQSMFWPMMLALFSYFRPYTLAACALLAVLAWAGRLIWTIVRNRRRRHAAEVKK